MVAPGAYLKVSARQQADLDGWLEARGLAGAPLVLLQAGNKRTMRWGLRRLAINHKYWPPERWAAVMRLSARPLSGASNRAARHGAGIPAERGADRGRPHPRRVQRRRRSAHSATRRAPVARRGTAHRRLGARARRRGGGMSAGRSIRQRLTHALPAMGNQRRGREGAHGARRRRAQHARHRRCRR